MGFLTPWGLLAGLVVPAILVLWLLRRRRQDRQVSSTYLWAQLVRQAPAETPWQRLRLTALLLLQLLAAAALVLALARPYLPPGALGSHLVLILDASGSMQGQGTWQRAQAEALDLIATLQPRDRVTVVAAGPAPQVLVTASRDRSAVRQAVAGLQPGYGSADLAQALAVAGAVSREDGDLQAALITARPPRLPNLPFPVTVRPVPGAAENLALSALGLRREGTGVAALARLTHHGSGERDYRVEMQVAGQPAERKTGRIGAGQAIDLVWTDLPAAPFYTANVLGGDDLAADDAVSAVLPPPGHVRALLVTPGNLFLESALSLRNGVEVVKAAPVGYAPGRFGLYVFDGWLPPELPPGPVLAIAPPERSLLGGAGSPFRVSRLLPVPGGLDLLTHVPLQDVHVERARRLTALPGMSTVLESPEGPLLLAGENGGRRVAALAFDLHDSDLPLRAAFPVLVQNLLDYLAPSTPVPPVTLAGAPLPVNLAPLVQTATVVKPDGSRLTLPASAGASTFSGAEAPGIYRLVQQFPTGQSEHLFAVNFPPRESDPEPLPLAGLASLSGPAAGRDLSAGAAPSLSGAGATAGVTLPVRAGQEIWEWLVLAALLCLAGEWWFYARAR